MHARAACRFEQLGYEPVYRYSPGKSDWRAAALPTEGSHADELRAHHAALRDVFTCSLDSRVSEAACAAHAADQNMCLVLAADGTVIGRIRGDALSEADDRRAEQVMEEGPTTTRADEDLAALTTRLHDRRVAQIIVTDPDGKLIGVVHRDHADQLIHSN